MKKCILLFLVTLCLFAALSCGAYALGDTEDCLYVDLDQDGDCDSWLTVSYDLEQRKVTVLSLETSLTDIILPEFVYDYCSVEYQITKIQKLDTGLDQVKSVEIPLSVTQIEPFAIGYTEKENDYFEDDFWFWFDDMSDDTTQWEKKEDFSIRCVEDSAACEYAIENGFSYSAYKSAEYFSVIFDAKKYSYTSQSIVPNVTVQYRGSDIVCDRDYQLRFENNVNAGTATAVVTGIGQYRGCHYFDFSITAKSASKATISAISAYDYTGSAIKPDPQITLDGKKLTKGTDYTLRYENNKLPGKAKLTVTFKGNYTGTKSVTFSIALAKMKGQKASATSNTVSLSWNKLKCTAYEVYRYNSKTKAYEYLKTVTSNSLKDKNLTQIKNYYYKVRAVLKSGENKYRNAFVKITVCTLPTTPTVKIVAGKNKATVKWNKNSRVDGYQIGLVDLNWYYQNWFYSYDSDDSAAIKTKKTIKANDTLSWSTKVGADEEYRFAVRSYKKVNDVTVYSEWSEVKTNISAEARANGAVLKPHFSLPVYQTQGKKTSLYWTMSISKSDVKLLESFIAKHFKKGMSREEQLRTTLEWINRNVKYAEGSDWNKISGKSYVEAIFKYKLGQCSQYNGAMAAMMAYLGYDVSLICGYRGNYPTRYWQHFWVEVKIDGVTYICETGNYECDGAWSYLLAKYSEARSSSHYIKNGKNL